MSTDRLPANVRIVLEMWNGASPYQLCRALCWFEGSGKYDPPSVEIKNQAFQKYRWLITDVSDEGDEFLRAQSFRDLVRCFDAVSQTLWNPDASMEQIDLATLRMERAETTLTRSFDSVIPEAKWN